MPHGRSCRLPEAGHVAVRPHLCHRALRLGVGVRQFEGLAGMARDVDDARVGDPRVAEAVARDAERAPQAQGAAERGSRQRRAVLVEAVDAVAVVRGDEDVARGGLRQVEGLGDPALDDPEPAGIAVGVLTTSSRPQFAIQTLPATSDFTPCGQLSGPAR